MTRKGLRGHPKSKKSHRTVPVPPHVLEGMSLLMTGRDWRVPCRCPLVTDTTAERARKAAAGPCPPAQDGECPAGKCGKEACDDPAHRIRRFAPRVMRHTARRRGSSGRGAGLYDVQALLGHEDYATTQRSARESTSRRTLTTR